jgi:cytochrome c-type biogenesis protein CcmH
MGKRLRMIVLTLVTGIGAALSLATPGFAVEPDEILSDPALEARARHISEGLRCLVCQNQSIDDSNAPLARDLRLLVRERLKKGDSDAQVMQFIEDRYGEFVLLRPPFNVRTLLLWFTPLLVLLVAVWISLRVFLKRTTPAAVPTLSGAEEEKLRALLADAEAGEPSGPSKAD